MDRDVPERRLCLSAGGGVSLRELDEDDAPAYYQLVERSREHLSRWLQWPDYVRTVEECATAIREFRDLRASSGALTFGIWHGNALAGVVCLLGVDRANERATLAYWLGASFLKQGLMTAACSALLEYAFTTLRLHRVELSAAVDNVESWRLAERLGFLLEGVQRESERLNGKYLDHRLYGLLAREWRVRGKEPLVEREHDRVERL